MKTAEQLGIPEDYLQALIKTLEHMQSGKMQEYSPKLDRFNSMEPTLFNMRVWSCGTVCCIGGAVEYFLGRDSSDVLNGNLGLEALFYPDVLFSTYKRTTDPSKITVEQGATALKNYLETGEANWTEVLKG